MYDKSPYAVSRGSFQTPVDPPVAGPFDDPQFQICVNEEWLPFMAGALKQLLLQATWVSMSDADLLTLQGKVFDLISAFGKVHAGCGVNTPSTLCLSGTFATETYGYEPTPGSDCAATWVDTSGWQGCVDSSNQTLLDIHRNFGVNTNITDVEFLVEGTVGQNIHYLVEWKKEGTVVNSDSGTFTFISSDFLFQRAATFNCDEVRLQVFNTDANDTASLTATDFKLCYFGLFPLAVTDLWAHDFDFTAGQFGFTGVTMFGSTAVWSSGTGWISTGTPGAGDNVFCTITHGDEGQPVSYLSWDATARSSGTSASDEELLAVSWPDENGTGGVKVSNLANPPPTADTHFIITDPIIEQHVFIRIQLADLGGGTADGVITLSHLHVSGRGFDPFA